MWNKLYQMYFNDIEFADLNINDKFRNWLQSNETSCIEAQKLLDEGKSLYEVLITLYTAYVKNEQFIKTWNDRLALQNQSPFDL